jgi:hypothetical protein
LNWAGISIAGEQSDLGMTDDIPLGHYFKRLTAICQLNLKTALARVTIFESFLTN